MKNDEVAKHVYLGQDMRNFYSHCVLCCITLGPAQRWPPPQPHVVQFVPTAAKSNATMCS